MRFFSRFSKSGEKSEEDKVLVDLGQTLGSLEGGRKAVTRAILEGYTKTATTTLIEVNGFLRATASWLREALNRLSALERNYAGERKGTYRNQEVLAQFNNNLEELTAIHKSLAKSSLTGRTALNAYGGYLTKNYEQLQSIKLSLESIFALLK